MGALIKPWALLLAISGWLPAQAQSSFILSDIRTQYRLDESVSVFIDDTDSLKFDDITSPEGLAQFKPSIGHLTFGYLKHPIWLQVKTKNTVKQAQWYLEIPAPFLEYVDFYQRTPEGWQHNVSGYYRSQSQRIVSHTGHVLPLLFDTDSTSQVFIKIGGSSPKTFPLYIQEEDSFNSKVRFEDVGYGIFFGILIVMFFYNLIIFFTLKQVNYLLYICTIVCTFLLFASASGYAGKFLWPENPDYNFYSGRMTMSLITIFLAAFTLRFLEVKKYTRVMYYILVSLIPLAIIAAVLVATNTVSSAGNNLLSLSTVAYLVTGIVCRIKGNRNANYFVAAWSVYLAGGLLLTLRNSGVFDFNFWTTHFVEIGAALETTLIAFALADQYRTLKQAKEDAQVLALRIQQEANELLEWKVTERTEQLSKANVELNSTIETVRQQSRVIESKNAELDGFFYRISHDLKGPISSLQGLYNLARMEIKDESAMALIERKNQQVQRLNNIITGLIHLTKLSDTTLRSERIDFEKIIDECLSSFSEGQKMEHIEVRKNIQASLEFHSEWTLITAIIQNLLENAIKYSRKESPFIRIEISTHKNAVTILVEDNGSGIAEEHQSKIFEMFYRATHHAPGTGLGLYILKRSVDRLNGTVTLTSKEGVGSTFIVQLPF